MKYKESIVASHTFTVDQFHQIMCELVKNSAQMEVTTVEGSKLLGTIIDSDEGQIVLATGRKNVYIVSYDSIKNYVIHDLDDKVAANVYGTNINVSVDTVEQLVTLERIEEETYLDFIVRLHGYMKRNSLVYLKVHGQYVEGEIIDIHPISEEEGYIDFVQHNEVGYPVSPVPFTHITTIYSSENLTALEKGDVL